MEAPDTVRLPVGVGTALGVELAADLVDGGPGGLAPGKDPPHHRGLRLEDFQVRGAARAAGGAPVAVGRLPGDHLAGAGSEQLAPPVPFAESRPARTRPADHALHLGEQPGLRVVLVQAGAVGEPHAHPEAGQLVEDEHLVGGGTGEPVRGQAPGHLEQPGLGGVPHLVQPGPVQPGPGVPVVAVLAGQFVPGGGHVRAQRLHLGADRAPLGLPLGGHPGIDHGLHDHPSITWPPSAAAGGRGEQELVAGRQRLLARVGVWGPGRAGRAGQLGPEVRLGRWPGDQPVQPAAGEPGGGQPGGTLLVGR